VSKGYLLVEVSIAYMILALAIAALVPTFILAIKATKNTEKIQVAMDLSTELLEEVRMRRWDETTETPAAYTSSPSTLGPDTGETATDKTYFDDVDDFNGWTEKGAKDPLNRTLNNFKAYDRSVVVSYANAFLVALSTPTTSDYKRVTVCTETYNLKPVCLYTVVTNR
jgi:type II secretory pathway pseudopilin PulG